MPIIGNPSKHIEKRKYSDDAFKNKQIWQLLSTKIFEQNIPDK